jgi:hypothetical protein
MLPGPTIIRKCSSCSGYIEQFQITSGNTFGVKIWTDGWRDAPMMPDQPLLVECPHCKALIWIEELEKTGEIDQWGGRDYKKGSEPYNTPGFDRYLEFLKAGKITPEKVQYIRMRAWWAGNDARRETGKKKPLSDTEVDNLQALADMLDDGDFDERLMKTEILRELGRFDEARKLLDHPFDEEYLKAVEIMQELIERGDSFVTEMRFN